MKKITIRVALRIALLYALFGGLWILLSDRLLAFLVSDVDTLTAFQTYKGEAFVLCSTLLIFFLLRHYLLLGQSAADLITRSSTERQQAEVSLRESEMRFSTVFHANPAAIALSRLDNQQLVDVNEAWQTMTGYSYVEAIGHTSLELNLWSDPEQRHALIDILRAQGTARAEVQIRQKSGEMRDVLLSAELIELAGVQCLLTMAQDITARKRAEEEIARAAREWQTTFNATNDAVWILDREQRVLRSNRMAEQFFQRPIEQLIGQHCWEIVHGTAQPIAACPILLAQHSLRRESAELQIEEEWFQVTVDPILDADNRYAGAVHIVSDITARKAAEQKFVEQLDELRRWHAVTLGREGRIMELKREVNALLAQIGQPPRYLSVAEGPQGLEDL